MNFVAISKVMGPVATKSPAKSFWITKGELRHSQRIFESL